MIVMYENNMNNMNNQKFITISQLSGMSHDQIDNLYRQGYQIADMNDIRSLSVGDISTWQFFFFGIWSYLAYKSYNTDHPIWAILFTALSLGTARGIYVNYKK